MYIDDWSNYFYNDILYKADKQMDNDSDMHFVFGTTYEIESWMDIDTALEKAFAAKKYTSTHVKLNWIKLFMDGTVEIGTGFIEPVYPDGSIILKEVLLGGLNNFSTVNNFLPPLLLIVQNKCLLRTNAAVSKRANMQIFCLLIKTC